MITEELSQEKAICHSFNVTEQLNFYKEKMHQVEVEKQRKDRENRELRNCLNKLESELVEKSQKVEYFNKLQIDDPSIPVTLYFPTK